MGCECSLLPKANTKAITLAIDGVQMLTAIDDLAAVRCKCSLLPKANTFFVTIHLGIQLLILHLKSAFYNALLQRTPLSSLEGIGVHAKRVQCACGKGSACMRKGISVHASK